MRTKKHFSTYALTSFTGFSGQNSYPPVRSFLDEISKMPKLGKQHRANKLNGKKSGYHLKFNGEHLHESDDNDEDFMYGSQPRYVDNSSSCFFMTLMKLRRDTKQISHRTRDSIVIWS